MNNFAYSVGNVIKIGIDHSDQTAAKQKADIQKMVDIGAIAFGVKTTQVVELWKRAADSRQECYRIYSFLLGKFKADVAYGNDWIKTTPEAVTYFKNHAEDPKLGDRFYKRVMIQFYNEPENGA